MSPELIGCVGLLILFVLLFCGLPIGFALAVVGFVGYALIAGVKPAFYNLATVPYASMFSYHFSVIPLFMLMGQIGSESGLIHGAYYGMHKWVGRLPGGLAMATIGGCAIFAAVVGDSVACATTMTTIAYPEMKHFKYDNKLSLGSIAAGGTLGILIPPSTVFIIYSIFAEESIGRLFMAGVFPGLIQTVLFLITIYIWSKLVPGLGPSGPEYTWTEKLSAIKDIWPVMFLILLVIGGLWGGVFSPTEAGGAGAFLALLIGLGRRQLTIKKLALSLRRTAEMTATILFILISAMIFSYFISITGLPQKLASVVTYLTLSPLTVLLTILFIYLILGCIMNAVTITVVTLPIFLPLLRGLGFDLVLFGVMFVIMSEMAIITPPIGLNVFVVSGMVQDVPMSTIYRGIFPFLPSMIIVVALIIIFPQIALFLPNTMIGGG